MCMYTRKIYVDIDSIKKIEANRGLMGGYKAAGMDEDYTHVILSKKDYNEIREQIRGLEKENADLFSKKRDQESQFKRALADQKWDEQSVRRQYELKLEEVRQEVETQKAAVIAAEAKNENLLRITRERANAARGIHPKKERSGYLFQNLEQFSYTKEDNRRIKINAWKLRLQSPYSICLDFASAQSCIFNDLISHGLGVELGIDGIDFTGEARKLVEVSSDAAPKGVYAYAAKYRGSGKGYWEIELTLNAPPEIPADLLPD